MGNSRGKPGPNLGLTQTPEPAARGRRMPCRRHRGDNCRLRPSAPQLFVPSWTPCATPADATAQKALLKKTYPLHVEGKHPDRLLEATKHEIRKYIKREQNKPRPAGVDFWDFDCRFGSSPATAEVIPMAALTERINAYAAEKADSFYVELLAKPGVRRPRPATGADEAEVND